MRARSTPAASLPRHPAEEIPRRVDLDLEPRLLHPAADERVRLVLGGGVADRGRRGRRRARSAPGAGSSRGSSLRQRARGAPSRRAGRAPPRRRRAASRRTDTSAANTTGAASARDRQRRLLHPDRGAAPRVAADLGRGGEREPVPRHPDDARGQEGSDDEPDRRVGEDGDEADRGRGRDPDRRSGPTRLRTRSDHAPTTIREATASTWIAASTAAASEPDHPRSSCR